MARNILTLGGFLCCLGHFGLLALYDYDFRSATAPPGVSGLPDVPAGLAVTSCTIPVCGQGIFLTIRLELLAILE